MRNGWPPRASNLLYYGKFGPTTEAIHEYTARLATPPRFLRQTPPDRTLPGPAHQRCRPAPLPPVRPPPRPDPVLRRRPARPPRPRPHRPLLPHHDPHARLRHPRRLRRPERPRHPPPRPRLQAPGRPLPRRRPAGQPAHPVTLREP